MAERRSLVNAIAMTPEQMAFIKGEGAKAAATKPPVNTDAKPTKTIEVNRPAPDTDGTHEPTPRIARRSSRSRTVQSAPEAAEILDQVLVPFTVRLPHRLAQELKTVHLQQRLRHAKPDTQQEIVEAAVSDWLAKHRFPE